MLAAGGAVNAGAVGVNGGLTRPRLLMLVSTAVLSVCALLGLLTAATPVTDVAVLAVLAALAGLASRAGKAASVIGVQALVGFVTLGRMPLPLPAALVAAGLVATGGLLQVLLGMVLRVDVARRTAQHVPPLARRVARPDSRDGDPVPDVLAGLWHALRHPDAAGRWHALRMVLCLVAAQSAALALVPDRGYWITLSALNVLKPEWVATASRGLDRWIGTTVGAVAVGALATSLHPTGLVLALLVALLTWGAFTTEAVNYALYTACLAGYVVFFEQVAAAAPSTSAWLRAVDTTAGAALAVAVRLVVTSRRGRRARQGVRSPS
jgi:hypothetical protein